MSVDNLFDPDLVDMVWGLERALDMPLEAFFCTAKGDAGSENAGKPLTFVCMPDAIDEATWVNDLLTNVVSFHDAVLRLPLELRAAAEEARAW
jgi:hypothetical protein